MRFAFCPVVMNEQGSSWILLSFGPSVLLGSSRARHFLLNSMSMEESSCDLPILLSIILEASVFSQKLGARETSKGSTLRVVNGPSPKPVYSVQKVLDRALNRSSSFFLF